VNPEEADPCVRASGAEAEGMPNASKLAAGDGDWVIGAEVRLSPVTWSCCLGALGALGAGECIAGG
jgi:hypothetical protein